MPTVCETLLATKTQLEKDIQNTYLPNLKVAENGAISELDGFYKDFGQYSCGNDVSGITASNASQITAFAGGTLISDVNCKGGSFNCSKQGCKDRINNNINPALSKYSAAYAAWYSATTTLASTNTQIAANAGCKAESAAATAAKAGIGTFAIVASLVVLAAAITTLVILKKKKII